MNLVGARPTRFVHMNHFRGGLVLMVAAVAVSLTGCAGTPAPTAPSTSATSSAASTPSPTPTPATLAKIEVGHDGLALVGSDGTAIETIRYSSDPATAVPALTQQIGTQPKLVKYSHGVCGGFGKTTTASWGSGLTVTYETSPAIPGFTVYSQSATVGSDARVETPYGFAVGDSIKDLIAGTPNAVVQGPDSTNTTRVFYDLDSKKQGGQADASESDVVTDLYAPGIVDEDC